MSKRTRSFLIIAIIYLIAIFVGITIFLWSPSLTLWLRLLVADLAATLIIWLFSLALKNASLYDPYWSVMPPVILILVGVYLQVPLTLSVFMLYVPLIIWAVRLTYNWASLWTGFQEMDWRYQKIKEKAPKLYPLTNLFAIQVFPTFIVFIQLLAALIYLQNNPEFNVIILIGSAMMTIAVFIQFISDEQMKAFKKKNKGLKLCIEEGLWKYSRHPNYFGEVTVWWGLYVLYLGYHQKIDLYILAPFMMTALFLFISIPWMEKKILITRPEYEDYQKRVSMLIPFFRKETPDIKTRKT